MESNDEQGAEKAKHLSSCKAVRTDDVGGAPFCHQRVRRHRNECKLQF